MSYTEFRLYTLEQCEGQPQASSPGDDLITAILNAAFEVWKEDSPKLAQLFKLGGELEKEGHRFWGDVARIAALVAQAIKLDKKSDD